MTTRRDDVPTPVASKPNYNRLARNKRKWNREAKRVVMKLSTSKYAAAKVEPKPFQYRELDVWL